MKKNLRTIGAMSLGWLILFFTCFTVNGRASDPTLDDFKKASRESGCKLIPYDDLSTNCYEDYQKQKEWCTGEKNLGCKDLDKNKEEDRSIAKERKDNASQCISWRLQVKKSYDLALDKLNYDQSHNENPEIRSLAVDIIQGIAKEEENHRNKEGEVENRRKTCEDVENNR